MRTLGKAVTGCVLVGTVIGIVACGSSSNSSSSSASSGSSGSSSSGKTVDIYSSLPLQGASNVQTIPDGQRDQARAGGGRQQGRPVDGQLHVAGRLDGAPAAQWDPGQTAGDARKAARTPKAVLLHRRVQLRRQRGLDPDPEPGRASSGQPRQHVRRADHQRAGQRPRRAAEVLPDRYPHVSADRAARLDPGRVGPRSR